MRQGLRLAPTDITDTLLTLARPMDTMVRAGSPADYSLEPARGMAGAVVGADGAAVGVTDVAGMATDVAGTATDVAGTAMVREDSLDGVIRAGPGVVAHSTVQPVEAFTVAVAEDSTGVVAVTVAAVDTVAVADTGKLAPE
jgi:hypothetical protein